MSFPALRQPKAHAKTQISADNNNNNTVPKKKLCATTEQNLIVTLKEGTKLVLTTDAFNGILTEGAMFKCVFCAATMDLDTTLKDIHVRTPKHLKAMESFRFSDDFPENMIRQISKETFYCTVCNVLVSHHYITRHISNGVHKDELSKAVKKALVYKPRV